MATGTCTVHSWNDGADTDEAEPPMGAKVNARLQWDPEFSGGTRPDGEPEPSNGRRGQGIRRGLRSRRVAMFGDDD